MTVERKYYYYSIYKLGGTLSHSLSIQLKIVIYVVSEEGEGCQLLYIECVRLLLHYLVAL